MHRDPRVNPWAETPEWWRCRWMQMATTLPFGTTVGGDHQASQPGRFNAGSAARHDTLGVVQAPVACGRPSTVRAEGHAVPGTERFIHSGRNDRGRSHATPTPCFLLRLSPAG